MCYMATRSSTVGVRELRQNLSVYLARVKAGEPLTVAERGQAVAMLVPLAPAASVLDRLFSSGRATRPTRRLEDLGPPKGPVSTRLSDALRAMRDEERY
jgi:prevent-host-death family protein